MFFLNPQYFIDQKKFLSFEEIVATHGLDYFSSRVKIVIFFSHRWLNRHVADNGDCFRECKNQVDQIITGFEDQREDLKYFGFFFDYSCIPQCSDQSLFPNSRNVLAKLKRLLLMELYQTLTQCATLYLCRSNSTDYYQRIWIVMELLIALDRKIEQIPTSFRADLHLHRLASLIRGISDDADLFQIVFQVTDGLECTLDEDKSIIQLTLYRYLKTRKTKVPIELMNLAMWDVHNGFKEALQGNARRLETHLAEGLANWKHTIKDMGFDREFLARFNKDPNW